MPVSPLSFVDRAALEAILKHRHRAADGVMDLPYTEFMIEQAEALVRSESSHEDWVGEVTASGQTAAPPRARIIATQLAAKGWSDKGNLARRTSGPVSESFHPGGFDFSEADLDWLHKQAPGGGSGLSFLRIGAGVRPTGQHIFAPGGEYLGTAGYFPYENAP